MWKLVCFTLSNALREEILQPFAVSPLTATVHAATFGEIVCLLLGRGGFTMFFPHSHNTHPKFTALNEVNGAEEISFASSCTVSAHKLSPQ